MNVEAKAQRFSATQSEPRLIKCLVWDLDNTLWHGVLLENDPVYVTEQVTDIISKLDERGILQSVASRNEYTPAMAKLQELGLDQYFLYPQINWNSKSSSLKTIAESINIGLNAIGFIDDQPFDREEVQFSLPEVLCIDAAQLDGLLERPELNPRFVTEDSKIRRLLYLSDVRRKEAEEEFSGPHEEFLATLDMNFTISSAQEEDLQRAEELTERTNQLNTTGYTYSYDELNFFRQSPDHKLLITSLDDKFGGYGKVGLALLECRKDLWIIKLLLMSCRVMARGVGTILLNHIMQLAQRANARLQAEFVSNNRNRMMYVTYNFAGFKEIGRNGEIAILENDLTRITSPPSYVNVQVFD